MGQCATSTIPDYKTNLTVTTPKQNELSADYLRTKYMAYDRWTSSQGKIEPCIGKAASGFCYESGAPVPEFDPYKNYPTVENK
jgi:hypothetical protein